MTYLIFSNNQPASSERYTNFAAFQSLYLFFRKGAERGIRPVHVKFDLHYDILR